MTPLRLLAARVASLLLAGLAFALPAAAQAPAPPLELVVLGSGGPGAAGRAASSFLVLVDGVARILVDAGPGSFARLGEARLSLAKTDIVLLTHLHADHAGGLPGLFKARAVSSGGPIEFKVFGPGGRQARKGQAGFPATSRFIDLLFGKDGAFGYLPGFSAPMKIRAQDIAAGAGRDAAPSTIFSEGGLVISASAGHHGDAPAVVYRIEHAGKSITFSGDIDAEGLPALRRIAKGTSLLVFNSVVLDPPGSPPVLYTLHTPPEAIGKLAEASSAGKLLLGHLTPAVEKARDAVAASIAGHYRGPTVFAEDGMRVQP